MAFAAKLERRGRRELAERVVASALGDAPSRTIVVRHARQAQGSSDPRGMGMAQSLVPHLCLDSGRHE
jgi:hypothetical protein